MRSPWPAGTVAKREVDSNCCAGGRGGRYYVGSGRFPPDRGTSILGNDNRASSEKEREPNGPVEERAREGMGGHLRRHGGQPVPRHPLRLERLEEAPARRRGSPRRL